VGGGFYLAATPASPGAKVGRRPGPEPLLDQPWGRHAGRSLVTHPRSTRWVTGYVAFCWHNNLMHPNDIIIAALVIIAAVATIGATAAVVMSLL
jgi:hypothetical protein